MATGSVLFVGCTSRTEFSRMEKTVLDFALTFLLRVLPLVGVAPSSTEFHALFVLKKIHFKLSKHILLNVTMYQS